jgi:hypothetical protein
LHTSSNRLDCYCYCMVVCDICVVDFADADADAVESDRIESGVQDC